MQIAAITVDYNRHADTYVCLDSLLKSIGVELHVIVVDNGSTEPLDLTAYPDIEFIRLDRNLGFAGGFNMGLRRALAGPYEAVLVINNDTFAAADMLAQLAAELTAETGIAAPRVFYAAQPDRIWSDGFRAHPLTLELYGGFRGRRAAESPTVRAYQVDYALGCALLISRAALEQVGLFDERYFAYYEDLDYCRRIRQAGFGLVTVTTAHLWHKVASTTGLNTPHRQYLLAYGSVLFFTRHAGWRWPIVGLYRLGSSIKTSIRLIMNRRTDLLRSHWRGLKDSIHDVLFIKQTG